MSTIFERVLLPVRRLIREPTAFAREACRNGRRNIQRELNEFAEKPLSDQRRTVGLHTFKVVNFLLACHLFIEHVGWICGMEGPSMEPTLANTGEWAFENRLSYKLRPDSIARGDLVTARSPLDPTRTICKRVIGLAGDVVCVDPTGRLAPSTEHVIVPKSHVWLVGDNAAASRDSREYGPVSTALIRGKISARIMPWGKRTLFTNPTTFID